MTAEDSIQVSSRERVVALAFLGAATVLRLPYTLRYRVNSDEPQHLHVVWAWARGLLPYRDVFDNHSPLFHVMMAPFLSLVGERPDALTVMRFVMVPLALLAIWLTYLIAAQLYTKRVAIWSAVLLGLHYEFFFESIEFRTDNLWTVGWLATLAVIVSGPLTQGRAMAAGAALGANLCVSQKTFLLTVALGGAALLTVALSDKAVRATRGLRVCRLFGPALAGFLVVPLAVTGFFAAHGALGPFIYGVFTHNALAGLGAWHQEWRPAVLVAGLALGAWLSAPRVRAAGRDRILVLRVLVALTVAIYVLSLESTWPLVTGQDRLPLFPLLAVFAVAGLDRWDRRRRGRATGRAATRCVPAATLLVVVLAELVVIVFKGPIWRDRAAAETALLASVLSLTGRGERVMDTKGETVFRSRPFFWVLETITIERLRRGLIPDTIADDVVRARCFVAVNDSARFPPRGRAFLNENFVPTGALRVAGRLLRPTGGPNSRADFAIAIPGPYSLVTPQGMARGTLDGAPYSTSRFLDAGRHEFLLEHEETQLAVVWARAATLGYSPFGQAQGSS